MSIAVQVTEFEMDILELFKEHIETRHSTEQVYDVASRMADDALAEEGNETYGPLWSGKPYGESYPKIHAGLGRLRNKGLVERMDPDYHTYARWGFWRLTPLGVEFLGIPPVLDTWS